MEKVAWRRWRGEDGVEKMAWRETGPRTRQDRDGPPTGEQANFERAPRRGQGDEDRARLGHLAWAAARVALGRDGTFPGAVALVGAG